MRVIDVGTGAGFPGIPVKIACPEIELTLLDSLQKRIGFLQEVGSQLGLEGVHYVHSRAEDGGQNPQYREGFDLCVSRAVANLSVLAEYCLPFICPISLCLSKKSPLPRKNIPEMQGKLKKNLLVESEKAFVGTVCVDMGFFLWNGFSPRRKILCYSVKKESYR